LNSTFEILKGLPPYGKMYIPIPERNLSEGFPVEFTKDNGTKWIANFEVDKTSESSNFIANLQESGEVIVIAKNVAYLIDRNKESPIITFKGYFEKIIEHEDFKILIGHECMVVLKSSEKIEFYNDLNYAFTSDITFSNGIIEIVLFEYNLPIEQRKTIHSIELEKINFGNFKANNYYQSNKIE
jgi:hypothetical protein